MTALPVHTAVVSGASRGIGLEITRALIGGGVHVAMLARSAGELELRAAELGSLAIPMPCDVAEPGAVRHVAQQIFNRFGGPPSTIVNNAARFTLQTVERTEPPDFRATIDVNLVAPFLLVNAFLGDMRVRNSGHIVTIGSIADRVAFPENGAYAASKFGLRAFHEVLRGELRGSGIRVTLISPGPVDTSMWDEVDPDNRPGFAPRRQMLVPAAVARAVLFALSESNDVNVDELRLSHT